jgi:hypothetical protein
MGLPSEGGEPNLKDIDPKDETEKARARKKEKQYQLYKDRDGSTISYDGKNKIEIRKMSKKTNADAMPARRSSRLKRQRPEDDAED